VTAAPPQPKQYFLALDGLRGVAALTVMVMHRGRWYYEPGGFLGHAYLAVDFFFLLSGFVIAFAYEDRLRSGLTFGRFTQLRLLRLYPLIALGMLTGALWAMAQWTFDLPGSRATGDLWQALGRHLLLIPTLGKNPAGIFPLNGPTWSLFFEIAINLVYALVLRWLRLRWVIAIVAVSALALVWYALSGDVDVGPTPRTFLGGFPRTAFGFFGGVLLFRLMRAKKLPTVGAPIWGLGLALLVVFTTPKFAPAANAVFDLACLFVLFPAILSLGAHAGPSRWDAISRVSGALSYPIYVLHYPLYMVIGGLLLMAGSPLGPPLQGLVAGALVVGISWAALKLYDEPLRAWLATAHFRRRADRTRLPA
jgi:peptidoglycan/LPS O-acetylase OafA/YrhL